MKLRALTLVLAAAISMQSAIAGKQFPLANGVIDGTSNFKGSVSLSSLMNTPYSYDITCTITDPTGAQDHAKFQFTNNVASTFTGMNTIGYKYDNNQLQYDSATQYVIKDSNAHRITFSLSSEQITSTSSIGFTWIAGADMTTPIAYNCVAEFMKVEKK